MTARPVLAWLAGLCGIGAVHCALAAPGLTVANYVDAADTIVDTLDTSAIAFHSMMLGWRIEDHVARPRPASLSETPGAPRTEAFETPCPGGGSVSGRVTDRDASGDLSVRDRFITTFNACRIGNDVVSGSSEFTITAHRTDAKGETTELEFRFVRLGGSTMRWTGSATAMLRSDDKTGAVQYVVTYRDLAVTRGAHAYRWSFTLDERRPPIGDHTARIGGLMTMDGTALRLVQDEQFVLAPDGVPRSGRLTATDAEGARLQIDATRRRYRYRYFNVGNDGEAPDSSSESASRAGR